MQQYKTINNPNLPDNDVLAVAVGSKYIETINSLSNLGINSFKITQNSRIPDYLSYHADLNIMHFNDNTLYFDNGIIVGELQKFFNVTPIGECSYNKYPGDCLLNSVRINDKLIYNEKAVSKDILNAAYNSGLTLIKVNQGYTKCSVCVVDDNCIITDDESVFKSTQNFFDDVLLISKGSIRLEGTNYGFIGGATGKIGKNKLAFNGRIDSHSDCNRIIDLLSKYNIEVVELNNDRLYDIGSIIPLLQKNEKS